MEFSWTLAATAVGLNLFWISAMFMAQHLDKSLPPRNSLIPGTRQKFLYANDFWTMTYGDVVGVSLIWVAFSHVAVNWFGAYTWMFFWAVAFLVALNFMRMCLKADHKPDWGYPAQGEISLGGYLHLPYFGFSVVAGVWCLGLVREPGIVLMIYLAGAVIYIICFVLEIKSGNFDPLKKVE